MRPSLVGAFVISTLWVAPSLAQPRVTVEEVVTTALQHDYQIKLSQNSTEFAATDARNAVGLFLPDVTLTGNRTWTKNDSRQTLADNSEVVRPNVKSNNLQAQAQMTWVLFDGLKMFAQYKTTHEIQAANELLLKAQMASTMSTVIGQYFNIVAQKQQLNAINEQLSVGEERVKLAERRVQVGSAAKTELLQARLDQNAFRTLALQQEALIIQTKATLNSNVGMQLPDVFDVADTIPLNLTLTIEEILDGMESTNPDLVAARQQVEASKALLAVRKGDRMPTLNFVSNYNFARVKNSVATNQFSPVFIQNNGFTYGFSAAWPLLNNFAVRNQVQLQTINIQRQQILYEQAKANALAALKVSYARYDNARKTLAIEEENISFARENVSIMLESFKRGVATFIELRTAQQSMVDAYNRLTTARYNAKVSETELLRMKGALLR